MKKIIALSVTLLLFVSCLSLSASAAPLTYDYYDYSAGPDSYAEVAFSEDFKTLYFGFDEYVLFNNENICNDVYYELENEITLTPAQNEKVSKIKLTSSEEGALIDAEIKYKDGINMELNYIKAEYIDEYSELFTSASAEYEIDFVFPEGNTVTVTRDKLFGEKFTIDDPSFYDSFEVLGWSSDDKICVSVGILIVYHDEFYYYDYMEAGTSYLDFTIYEEDFIEAYKITDADIVAALTEAEKSYYADDFGFFLDDNFTKKVADIFLIIIFAIIPFATLVLFTIFAFRSKGIYKKLYFAVSSFSAAELIIFTIIALLVT